jgi:trimeric autotransporter adhesin
VPGRSRRPGALWRFQMQAAKTLALAVAILLAIAIAAHAQCEPVWSSLGGLDGAGNRAFAVYDDDGAGPVAPALFTGPSLGELRTVTRWDGWRASAVGALPPDRTVRCLQVVPSGGALAPGLYAGGTFDQAAGVVANNIARWDGSEWHDVGGGVTRPGFFITYVFAMQCSTRTARGRFRLRCSSAAVRSTPAAFRSTGWRAGTASEWSAGRRRLGAGGHATVYDMAVYDDGRGPALYVGGSFNLAGWGARATTSRAGTARVGAGWAAASTRPSNRCACSTRTGRGRSRPPCSPAASSAG